MVQLAFPFWLPVCFFLVAILYSSVGHGGASAYLGILALMGLGRPEIAPVVLALNILVATLGVFNYKRAGFFSFKLLLPFILTSIPAAYLGGSLEVSPQIFSVILGVTLFGAGVRLVLMRKVVQSKFSGGDEVSYWAGLPIGFGLGFLAGLIGIGGGIFLSPLILLLNWANAKKTAAVSAAFIVLNSMSALGAHLWREDFNVELFLPLAIAVLFGGLVGSWLGAFRFPPVVLQRMLGMVLLAASIKLGWVNLWVNQ